MARLRAVGVRPLRHHPRPLSSRHRGNGSAGSRFFLRRTVALDAGPGERSGEPCGRHVRISPLSVAGSPVRRSRRRPRRTRPRHARGIRSAHHVNTGDENENHRRRRGRSCLDSPAAVRSAARRGNLGERRRHVEPDGAALGSGRGRNPPGRQLAHLHHGPRGLAAHQDDAVGGGVAPTTATNPLTIHTPPGGTRSNWG
jgi:hypothetical protein